MVHDDKILVLALMLSNKRLDCFIVRAVKSVTALAVIFKQGT